MPLMPVMSTIFQQMCVEHGLLCAAALGVPLFYFERYNFLMGWEVVISPTLPGYSCESQVITVCQDIADSMDNGDRIDAVVIDFSKA